MRIFQNANFPFLAWRRRAYISSAVLLVLSVGAFVWNMVDPSLRSWVSYGVDFTGGTIVQVRFDNDTDVEDIRALSGAENWEIYRYGSENEFVLRTPAFTQGTDEDVTEVVIATLGEQFDPGEFSVVRTEAVGPKVGAELQRQALIAILLSLAATMIYLAYRFEWRFGLAAVIATAHDVLITLGYIALFRSEVSLTTVAAMLTVVGYSLNDTIVVFDRIRENLGLPHRGQSHTEILDRSVNETLPRTVLTGPAVLATLLSLALFGGPVIRDFALVLIVGTLVATYSSIFVATPILHAVQNRWPPTARKEGARPKRRQEAPVG